MYESARDALTHCTPNCQKGGYIIIDDYHIEACMKAVEDYRNANNIFEPISWVDQAGVFWQRSG